jgi:beta-lactamase class A
MTVTDLCTAAMQYSDNTASNLLMKILGGVEAVTAFPIYTAQGEKDAKAQSDVVASASRIVVDWLG